MKTVRKPKTVKAFTLVELIVVMVILAILIGLTVPSVSKYIDKAGELAIKTEARSCLTAMQSYAAEQYADTRKTGNALRDVLRADMTGSSSGTTGKSNSSKVYEMANIPTAGYVDGSTITFEGSKLTGFKYKNGSQTITWTSAKGFDAVKNE